MKNPSLTERAGASVSNKSLKRPGAQAADAKPLLHVDQGPFLDASNVAWSSMLSIFLTVKPTQCRILMVHREE